VYDTYARYSDRAIPVTHYEGWTRRASAASSNKIPECVYIYGFYSIAHYLMPEQVAAYNFKAKYETDSQYRCNLTKVNLSMDTELGQVQKDVEQLVSRLKIDGFNQDGCFADTSNFR
jgi:hypothetical protein